MNQSVVSGIKNKRGFICAIFFIVVFLFHFPLVAHAENDADLHYNVRIVDYNGNPFNARYAFYKEENNGYKLFKSGYIIKDQKLPPDCMVCVDDGAYFTLNLYTPLVMSSNGAVEVKDFFKQEWGTVKKDTLLNQGDEIKTTAGSVCEIQIGKNALRIYTDSNVILTSMNSDEVTINVQSGKVLAMVEGLGQGALLRIITPKTKFETTEASFLVDSSGPSLSVYRGTVNATVVSDGQRFEVPQEKGSVQLPDGSLKQTDLEKNSPDFNQAVAFENSAKQSLSQLENQKRTSSKIYTISAVSQDILLNYMDPILEGTKHRVITTTTNVASGAVKVGMMFHDKLIQTTDEKLTTAGQTTVVRLVCGGDPIGPELTKRSIADQRMDIY